MTGHDDHARLAAVFAENVRREMRDLPPDVVADLTDGLEADIVASLADGAVVPDAVRYARDLMRAAGIDVIESSHSGIVGRVRRASRVLGRVVEFVRHNARGLAPAWWVFRAWVLMQMLGFVASGTDSQWWFLGQWGGEGHANGYVGVIAFAGFLYVSIRVGRDGWLFSRRQETGVSAVLAVFALSVIFSYNTAQPFPGVYGDPNMWPGATTVPPTDCQEMPDGSPDTVQQSVVPEPTSTVSVPMGDVTTTTAPRNSLTTTTSSPKAKATTTTVP